MRWNADGLVGLLLFVGALVPWSASACPGPEELPVIGGEPLSDPDDLIGNVAVDRDGNHLGVVQDVTLDGCLTPDAVIVRVEGSTRTVVVPIRHVLSQSDGSGSFLVDRTAAAILAPTLYGSSGPTTLDSGSSGPHARSR